MFGTAVGSGMVRFRTAAICCSLFVLLGAVISGAGAAMTLGELGSINAVAGAFMVAFAAAFSVYLMTRLGLPVSTSQAIVGAIIGWNLFSESLTDTHALTKIVLTWVLCPALAAVIAMALYKLVALLINLTRIHMFRLDAMTRYGLLLAGIFGSYSLGANNIANVMGVFVPVSPFSEISFYGLFRLSSAQQLFFIGAVAIGVGVLTYSRRVMRTVGGGIMKLSPVAAMVVVWAHSLVLFLFASQGLEGLLRRQGLPALPLVPVSSSQAIVGAVIGIGLLKGGRGIRWRTVAGIASGWVTTPLIAALFSFVSLFFLQNVFQQETFRPVTYRVTDAASERVLATGADLASAALLAGRDFPSAIRFKAALKAQGLSPEGIAIVMAYAEVAPLKITREKINRIKAGWITAAQKKALANLIGCSFVHRWQFREALLKTGPAWAPLPPGDVQDPELEAKLTYLFKLFQE